MSLDHRGECHLGAGYENMAWEDLGPAMPGIDRVKPLDPITLLVDRVGAARFVIACPEQPEYRDLAYGLQEAVLGSLAGPVRVLSPEAVTEEQRKRWHVVALGNIANNSLLAQLYHAYYAAVDHAYPGPGGYVLQTAYDPWGYGNNVIVCGGSDLEGVRAAVDAAVAHLLDEAGTRSFPRLHDIAISPAFKARYPSISFDCTPEHREWAVAHTYERLEQGMHRGATPLVSHVGIMYQLTGDDRFAELYRDLFKIMYQSAANDPGTGPWSPWGFDADFQSVPMLQAWDLVEECPLFSDKDRLYITNHLLWYCRYMVEHLKGHRPTHLRSPRHNHYTFAALGLLFGAKYFHKYYRLPEAAEWLALTDECFQTQAEAFKANEDCNSYQWLTFCHVLKYALVRPDPAFLESGNARLCLDLGVATMDNLGYQVPYGDVREYTGTFSEVPYYKAVSFLLGDPAYAVVLARKEQVRPEHSVDGLLPVGYEYELALEGGRALRQFMGVSRLPVDPMYFEHFGGPAQIQYGKSFDKVVFRHSLDPLDDYLLLDGLSNGGHLHRDGNSIVRYTSKARIWLEDADYMKVPQKFHNSLLVFRDGRGALIPDYAELEQASWLDPFGYSCSTVRGYCGTDWARHILELRGQGFLVLDEVVALQPGAYDLRCLWRTIGDASLDVQGRTLTVAQDGERMHLVCAPGFSAAAGMVLKQEPMIWGSWDRYPYHGQTADVKVLQERASEQLDTGDRRAFVNLFGTEGPYPPMVRLAEALVCCTGDQPSLIGTGKGLMTWDAAWQTDARFVFISPRKVFLVAVCVLGISRAEVLRTDRPLTLLLDLEAGTIRSEQVGEMWLADGSSRISLVSGVRAMPSEWLSVLREHVTRVLGGAMASPGGQPAVAYPKTEPQVGSQGRLVWELALSQAPYSICLDQVGAEGPVPFYVGTEPGSLVRIDGGKIVWESRAQARVNSIATADLYRNGQRQVILGSADHHVYVFDVSGRELWRRELPCYMHDPTVEAVTTAELGLAGGRAVIAGSNNCYVHAFSAQGDELWRWEVIHGVNDLAATDMTGNGLDEVLAVTEWWTWQCIDASGKGLWRVWNVRPHYSPGANVVRAADVNGDGVPEMIVGAIDSCVYAFDKSGERMWEFFTGEEISALECVDLDGDGTAEIVAGAMNGYVYALNGRGEEVWHRGLGEEINSLVVVREGPMPQVVVGTNGPRFFVLDADGSVRSSVDTGHLLRQVAARQVSGEIQVYVAAVDGHIAMYKFPVRLGAR